MTKTFTERRQEMASAIYAELRGRLPPMEPLEKLMGSRCPPYEADPIAYTKWTHSALGRWCFVLADAFVAGYEEQHVGTLL